MFRLVASALVMSELGLCSPLRADDAEDKAVTIVKKLGARVTRDEKAPGKPVVTVDLWVTQVTDAGLKELAPLKNLMTLNRPDWSVSMPHRGPALLRRRYPTDQDKCATR